MKVNPIKQFVRNNTALLDKSSNKFNRIFNLYDKKGVYRGEYVFKRVSSSDYLGVRSSRSYTRIMSEDLKLEMQEFVNMDKKYVTIYNPTSDLKIKALPSKITTITTILDYINDKFKTIVNVSKLKNKLQKINKDNLDFICSDSFVIYEQLEEKPQYEKSVEYIREGSISEANKKAEQNRITRSTYQSIYGSTDQIPYRYW